MNGHTSEYVHVRYMRIYEGFVMSQIDLEV